MFYGEYTHTVDKKGRIIIPAKFREPIQDKGGESIFITRGLEECLFVFTQREWRKQEEKFRNMAFTKKQVRAFQRQFFGGASETLPDRQWRILVPDYLREYAGLSKDIKILGVADRIEIWDAAKWESFYSVTKDNYEDIAEQLMDF